MVHQNECVSAANGERIAMMMVTVLVAVTVIIVTITAFNYYDDKTLTAESTKNVKNMNYAALAVLAFTLLIGLYSSIYQTANLTTACERAVGSSSL